MQRTGEGLIPGGDPSGGPQPVDMDPERQEAEAEADAIGRQGEADADSIAQRSRQAHDYTMREQQNASDEIRQGSSGKSKKAHDAAMAAEIQRMEAEIRRREEEIRRLKLITLHPRHSFMRLFIKDLETNPHSQYTVHRWGLYYWLINFPAVTLLFFFEPKLWLKLGIFITLIYSIYANASTDYGAMSAAMAAYEDRYLPPIPGMPFIGGMGGTGGRGGMGGSGGAGKDGEPGGQGAPGEPGEPGERPAQ